MRRAAWWGTGFVVVAALVFLMATAPTHLAAGKLAAPQSRATAVANAALIVFREGLEAVLIFAAVTVSFLGANRARRRPVVAGAVTAVAACALTWVGFDAVLAAASSLGPRLEAITGFIAVLVLLLILNWFVHHVYWTGWIARHHRRRRQLLASAGAGATLGLIALGFTSVFREGFEIVLFLQAMKVRTGTGAVVEGLLLGLAGTLAVGVVTFALHQRLPYRRMLVLTGILVGSVLVMITGSTALSFQELGWLPRHPLPFPLPGWLGSWFEVHPSWEAVGCQTLAAVFVIGSYYLARHVQLVRPRRRGELADQAASSPAPA
jgi:high-affinity iron transporter